MSVMHDVMTTKYFSLTFKIAAADVHIHALCILSFNDYLILYFFAVNIILEQQ